MAGARPAAVRMGDDVHPGARTIDPRVPAGLAYVATVSFLASRVSPSGAFWLAIAGGIALARTAASAGWRAGYGVGIAAMLQTTAIMGPARFSGPLTQALTAPLLGALHRRGTPIVLQLAACFGIRLTHYVLLAATFVWVILGGVDAFTGTYDALTGWLGFLPQGQDAAIGATLAIYGITALFYSAIQVVVYRHALRSWPEVADPRLARDGEIATAHPAGRFDPRAVAVSTAVMFAMLLAPPTWPLLAAVATWLALSTVTSRPDPQPLRLGLALTVLLAATAFGAAFIADLGTDEAARRAVRAALIVLVATWLRAAAGAEGLREVFTRALARLEWLPAVPEASTTLRGLDPRGALVAPGRELVSRLGRTPPRPLAITDTVVGWVASEAAGFRGATPSSPVLRIRFPDVALLALTATLALVGRLA